MPAATSLGLLYAAPAAGALLAVATSGWTGRVHHHGRAVILAVLAWGLAITGLGPAPSVPRACARRCGGSASLPDPPAPLD
jgi:hypothetical protein